MFFSSLLAVEITGEKEWKLVGSITALDLKQNIKGDCLFAIYDKSNDTFTYLNSVNLSLNEKKLSKGEGLFIKKNQDADCSITLDPLNASNSQSSFIDTRDNKTYKLVKIDNLLWFSEDFEFNYKNDDKEGSTLFKNSQNSKNGGRLYSWIGAYRAAPEGFRLPTPKEWKTLLETYKKELLVGGSIGFNLNMKPFSSCFSVGNCASGAQHYWTNEFQEAKIAGKSLYDTKGYLIPMLSKYAAVFNPKQFTIAISTQQPSGIFFYVRYVKEANGEIK